MQLWPEKRPDREVLWLERGRGFLVGGLFRCGRLIVSLRRQAPYLFEAAGG